MTCCDLFLIKHLELNMKWGGIIYGQGKGT